MPAVSKAQQKLFGMVHALQTGRAKSSHFSPVITKMAKKMSSSDVKKYSTTHISNLPDKIREILRAPDVTNLRSKIEPYRDKGAEAVPTHPWSVGETAGAIPASDFPPATSDGDTPHISNDPNLVHFDNESATRHHKILSVIKNRIPAEIDGELVDVYTAAMVAKVLHKLSMKNRKKLMQMSMPRALAVVNKMIHTS